MASSYDGTGPGSKIETVISTKLDKTGISELEKELDKVHTESEEATKRQQQLDEQAHKKKISNLQEERKEIQKNAQAAAQAGGAGGTAGGAGGVKYDFKGIKSDLKTLGNTAEEGSKKTSKLGYSLLQVAQFADDAQYGIRGVINNIPGLLMSFGAGAGLAGVITVATIAGVKLWEVLSDDNGATEKIKKTKEEIASLKDEVDELKFEEDLAAAEEARAIAATELREKHEAITQEIQRQYELSIKKIRLDASLKHDAFEIERYQAYEDFYKGNINNEELNERLLSIDNKRFESESAAKKEEAQANVVKAQTERQNAEKEYSEKKKVYDKLSLVPNIKEGDIKEIYENFLSNKENYRKAKRLDPRDFVNDADERDIRRQVETDASVAESDRDDEVKKRLSMLGIRRKWDREDVERRRYEADLKKIDNLEEALKDAGFNLGEKELVTPDLYGSYAKSDVSKENIDKLVSVFADFSEAFSKAAQDRKTAEDRVDKAKDEEATALNNRDAVTAKIESEGRVRDAKRSMERARAENQTKREADREYYQNEIDREEKRLEKKTTQGRAQLGTLGGRADRLRGTDTIQKIGDEVHRIASDDINEGQYSQLESVLQQLQNLNPQAGRQNLINIVSEALSIVQTTLETQNSTQQSIKDLESRLKSLSGQVRANSRMNKS